MVQFSVTVVSSHDAKSASANTSPGDPHRAIVSTLLASRLAASEVVFPFWLDADSDLLVAPSVMPKPKYASVAGLSASV